MLKITTNPTATMDQTNNKPNQNNRDGARWHQRKFKIVIRSTAYFITGADTDPPVETNAALLSSSHPNVLQVITIPDPQPDIAT